MTNPLSRKYATKTKVPIAETQRAIEQELSKHGATGFAFGWQAGKASLMFLIGGKQYRFELRLCDDDQQNRASWRALYLVVKAKLVAVQNEISTFEAEFLSAMVMPNKRTLGEMILPQMDKLQIDGQLPKLLPWGAYD